MGSRVKTKKDKHQIIVLVTVAVLSLAAVTFYLVSQPKIEVKNTHLYFSNAAPGFLNETSFVTVTIDEQVVCNNNDIGKTENQSVNLNTGKHTITIYNLKKDVAITKNFTIQNNKDAFIYIRYCHDPEYEVYLPFYKENYLKRLMQKNKEIDSLAVKQKIDSLMDIDYLKTKVGYRPQAPNFKIDIEDHAHMIL